MKSEKITKSDPGSRRTYEDACGAAHALDLVGERWALLVMRELLLGPKRFSDLRTDLPGISANVLTQRLEGLEAAGIVTRRRLPSPGFAQVYALTPWGYESEPIFQALGRWAARSPAHDPTLPVSAVSILISFRTMLDRERAKGFAAQVGFRMGRETFVATVANGDITVARGETDGAAATLTGQPPVIAAAVYGGQALEDLEAAGALVVEGDRQVARRFTRLFALPPKAERV